MDALQHDSCECHTIHTLPKRAQRAKAYRGVDKVVRHKRRGEEESEGEDEAEVEAIVGKAMRDGVVHYVVRWKGYGEGDDAKERSHCSIVRSW